MSKKIKLVHKRNGKDEISKLCDDLLIRILSFLSYNEAVRSSVITRRWQHLWKYFSGCLRFKLLDSTPTYLDLDEPQPIEVQNRFVEWLNKSLNSLQASTIDEFRVHNFLDNGFKSHVDAWVEFALQRKVKKLELNFAPDLYCYYLSLMRKKVASACYCLTKETFASGLAGIQSLTCLSFNFVGISDETLEYILSSCPLLESLEVSCSARLRHPKVSASRLKHLSLYCRIVSVQSIEIHAPNLASFEYYGGKIPLHVKYAPKLDRVYYNDNSNNLIPHLSSQLAGHLPRLVALSIGTSFLGASQNFPKLLSLKHLRCEAIARNAATMRCLTSLIEAAPFLHKFELVVCSTDRVYMIKESELPEMWRRVREHPNKYIKEVEMVDFRAGEAHAEMLAYLLKNAVMLEKLVVDTSRVFIAREDYRALLGGSRYRKKRRAKCIIDRLLQFRPGPRLVLI